MTQYRGFYTECKVCGAVTEYSADDCADPSAAYDCADVSCPGKQRFVGNVKPEGDHTSPAETSSQ